MTEYNRRPGLALAFPDLKEATSENEKYFSRWIKSHSRDLLNLPKDPKHGRITEALHLTSGDFGKYLNIFIAEDIDVFKTKAWSDSPRHLNLETSRKLGTAEEPVNHPNGDAGINDLMNARGGIFEEVHSVHSDQLRPIGSFQHLPKHFLSESDTKPSAPYSSLAVVRLNFASAATQSPSAPSKVQASLLEIFNSMAPPNLQPFTSLYRWAGDEAQPAGRLKMEDTEWLVLLLIVDEEGGTLVREHVPGMLGHWAPGVQEKESVKVEWTVWNGDAFMR